MPGVLYPQPHTVTTILGPEVTLQCWLSMWRAWAESPTQQEKHYAPSEPPLPLPGGACYTPGQPVSFFINLLARHLLMSSYLVTTVLFVHYSACLSFRELV